MKLSLIQWSHRAFALGAMALCLNSVSTCYADVKLPNVFSDHMVLQQGQENKIWGTAAAGEKVSISIADKSMDTKADEKGNWSAKLPSLPVGGPHKLRVAGSNVDESRCGRSRNPFGGFWFARRADSECVCVVIAI